MKTKIFDMTCSWDLMLVQSFGIESPPLLSLSLTHLVSGRVITYSRPQRPGPPVLDKT